LKVLRIITQFEFVRSVFAAIVDDYMNYISLIPKLKNAFSDLENSLALTRKGAAKTY